jgi:hypothetical protein
MSNIISDYNEDNNPTVVKDVKLPDTAVKVESTTTQQPVVYPDFGLPQPEEQQRDQYGNLPTVVRGTLNDYTPLPEAPKKEHVPLGNFASPAVGVTYPTPQMDLNSSLPTQEEFAQQVTEQHQQRIDWLSAQVANYTPAPVYDVTTNGLNYLMESPGVGLTVPDNLYWKENEAAAQQAAYEAAVQQEQARLNQQGYDIQPQQNVVAQQGGFNSGGTAQQGWTIGGLWNDFQGALRVAGRTVQSFGEAAIGRPIQNPLDVAEAVLKGNFIYKGTESTIATFQGKGDEWAANDKKKNDAAFARNFAKMTPNEVNLLAGGISQKGPVNLSRGQFGEQGSGVLGAVNYGLDNFLGGNAIIRAPFANIKRNIDNARAGRPQQWDEGFGVIAALKGESYSGLADSNDNPDTSFVGKDKHGQEFWIRATGGFIYDAVTDLSPLGIVKQGIKKGGKLALKQAINNVPASSVIQMVDAGDVVVEVAKKGGQQDVKTVPLAQILSPEKRQSYEKQGLVVIGAKQVKGPSPKKLTQQATREAKRVAKGKKPKTQKTPDIQYEFITMKRSELVEKSINTLTPTTGDVLNKVVAEPTKVITPPKSTSEIFDGYRVPTDPKTGKKIYPLGADGKPLDTAEKLQVARTAKTKEIVDSNPLLQEVVYGPKTKRASQSAAQERLAELDLPVVSDVPKARDVAVLAPEVPVAKKPVGDVGGQIVDTTVRGATPQLPPITAVVKEALLQPELPPAFKQQLLEPGAIENVLKQAEADGTIRIDSDGLIKEVPDIRNLEVESAQKELIRLRIEQNKLKETPNFDLVGQPGTKLGNQVAELQTRIDAVRSTITGGKIRQEFYDVITPSDLDRVIPTIPESLSNPLPNTPSSLFTRLKNEGRVFAPGDFVERSVDDLSTLAEYLGHKQPGSKLTATGVAELRQLYGMVYSRIGEPINKQAIRQYLDTGVGRVKVKSYTPTNGTQESVVIRRSTKGEDVRTVEQVSQVPVQSPVIDELVSTKDVLLESLQTDVSDLTVLQKRYDEVLLAKQLLEEADPQEARKVQKYFSSLPSKPDTSETEKLARLVYEGEQTVADTTQRIRDINLEIEAVRETLDELNDMLRKKPNIEPQPLDVGTYELGTVSEQVLSTKRITKKALPARPLTEYGSTINNQVYWFGSSFDDALQYGPEAILPTRNVVGLGHYVYREGTDAENVARALLTDNHLDVGLTPNENGLVTKVAIPDVRNPLNGELYPDSNVIDVFRRAIEQSFDTEEVSKLLNWWTDRVDEAPLGVFWDDLTAVWGRKFPTTPIPEAKFRAFEVSVSDGLLGLGYDAITFKHGVNILDPELIEQIGKSIELPETPYYSKALARVNVEGLSGSKLFSSSRDTFRLATVIEAAESYVDELMSLLDKALRDNDIALEQLMRNEEELEAMLVSDKVAKTLAVQEEAAEQVGKETDTLLKQNDEHPSCL